MYLAGAWIRQSRALHQTLPCSGHSEADVRKAGDWREKGHRSYICPIALESGAVHFEDDSDDECEE